jgi:hypothetical protein
MKKIILFLLSFMLLIILSSCKKTETPDITIQTVKTPEINTISYSTVSLESLSENARELIDEIKVQRGYMLLDNKKFDLPNDNIYVFMGSGEKNTGGYSIMVDSIQQSKNLITIVVKEEAPQKDAVVTQVISYPYTIVKINKPYTENIKVVNTIGETLPQLSDSKTTINLEPIGEVLDEGIYVGKIDDNSITVNMHGSAMLFTFSEKAKISFGGLKPRLGERIFVRYYINENGQFVLINISR